MKSILVDKISKLDCLQGFTATIDGLQYCKHCMAKPMNYDIEYLGEDVRKAMAQEVLEGHAIAVHFTEDEIAVGELPSLILDEHSRITHAGYYAMSVEENGKSVIHCVKAGETTNACCGHDMPTVASKILCYGNDSDMRNFFASEVNAGRSVCHKCVEGLYAKGI